MSRTPSKYAPESHGQLASRAQVLRPNLKPGTTFLDGRKHKCIIWHDGSVRRVTKIAEKNFGPFKQLMKAAAARATDKAEESPAE